MANKKEFSEKMSKIKSHTPITKTPKQKEQDLAKLKKAHEAGKNKNLSNPETHAKTVVSKRINNLIQSSMLDFLRDALTQVDETTGHAYYEDYINAFLQNAKEDPQGVCSRMLGASMFSSETLNKLDAAANKMMKKDQAFTKYRIEQTLYKQQKEVFNDTAKTIMAICSRQVGKSFLSSRILVWKALEQDNAQVMYINLKFENAIIQCYDRVIQLLEELNIPTTKASRADGTITFPNGSMIMFKGNSNSSEKSKFQGFTLDACIMDEVQTQPCVKDIIDTYIRPALKIKNGTLYLFGTPPRNANNVVFDIWNDWDGIAKYNWNMFDAKNYLPGDPVEFVERLCKEKGISQDTPFIQREYYGIIGALDQEAMTFHPTIYNEISPQFKPIKYYIGIDQGTLDNDSIVVMKVGMEEGKPKAYVVEEYKWNKKTIQFFATQLKDVIKRMDLPYEIVVDSAAVQFAFELQQTYSIPNIRMAYKYDKALSIDQLEELFLTKAVVVKEGGPVWNECQNIMYVRNDNDTIEHIIDDTIYHPDITDALRYSSRQFIFDYGRYLNMATKEAKPLDLQAHKRPQSFSVLAQRAAMLQR